MIRGKATINRPRNRFKSDHEVSTTFDGGLVIPLNWYEILPGDSLELSTDYILRMLTPLQAVMDNAWLDVKCFFVPLEVIFRQFPQFMGQNEESAWTESATYTIPMISPLYGDANMETGDDVCPVGSIGDYMGLPTKAHTVDGSTWALEDVSALPLRAYLKTWNYWYRDQNIVDPVLFPVDSDPGTSVGAYSVGYSSTPLPSMKLPDYFTTVLPAPTKIDPVLLGAGMPVGTMQDSHTEGDKSPLHLVKSDTGASVSATGLKTVVGGLSYTGTGDLSSVGSLRPDNLYTVGGAITIEDIRRAAVYQHVGEILARGGSRYASEFLVNIFGVKNSESLLSEPELLGGFTKMINMTEVLSQADTGSSGRIIGDNGAYSKTLGKNGFLCQNTFTRHGIVLVLATVRHEETYFQGIEKKWLRKSFWDFYLPQAQGLGYQKLYKKELYYGPSQNDIFGYQDYGAEYRFIPSKLTGYMRPDVDGALSTWTWASILQNYPVLNEQFMKADKTGFERTIGIQKEGMQFFGSFHFNAKWTRVVGVQRFPGLDKI